MADLIIRRLDTREEIHRVHVENTGQVQKVMLGMLRNMNTKEYFIDDSEFGEPQKQEA